MTDSVGAVPTRCGTHYHRPPLWDKFRAAAGEPCRDTVRSSSRHTATGRVADNSARNRTLLLKRRSALNAADELLLEVMQNASAWGLQSQGKRFTTSTICRTRQRKVAALATAAVLPDPLFAQAFQLLTTALALRAARGSWRTWIIALQMATLRV